MYAQVTRFKIKPGQLAAAKQVRDDVDPMIRAVTGIRQHLTLLDEDGVGLVIAIREGGEPSAETRVQIAEIWDRFAGLFEAEPQREQFEVFRDVSID
ncbi:MAG: hypothetical protein OER92_09520 [Alphaproteobacteria bacterium]|nr:hypothetical protein [Alphaproteobacteria bacterium]